MRIVIVLLVVAASFCLPVPAAAQSLSSIDFSRSQLSSAGPNSFYIRQVGVEGKLVSILIVQKADGSGWRIEKISPETDNILPSGIILDFSTIKVVDNATMEIGGILLNGKVYKGRIALGDTNTVAFLGETEEAAVGPESAGKAYKAFQSLVEAEKARYESEKQVLNGEIDRLKKENASLGAQLADHKKKLAELENARSAEARFLAQVEKRNAELEAELASLKLKVAELAMLGKEQNSQLDSLKKERDNLAEKVKALETAQAAADAKTVADAKAAGKPQVWLEPTKDQPPKNGKPREAAAPAAEPVVSGGLLETRVKELNERVKSLETEIKGMTAKLEAMSKAGWFGVQKDGFTKLILEGFKGAVSQTGKWKINGDTAEQLDKNQYFAKLNIPVRQTGLQTLYSFTAKAAAKGWVGLGLHLYVDDVQKKKSWGQGKSLLVWLTRDPETYKNQSSYLQLYRSDDDIHMERVVDAKIEENMGNFIRVDVLYDPVNEYVTVALNGVEKLRYKTFFAVDRGVSVAIRSLGPGAVFKNLKVAVKP
jgi:hypothetical protein